MVLNVLDGVAGAAYLKWRFAFNGTNCAELSARLGSQWIGISCFCNQLINTQLACLAGLMSNFLSCMKSPLFGSRCELVS